MGGAFQKAFDLLFSSDAQLWNIVSVTMRMTLQAP
jgi:ABC-type tungstate transport system substrate-binding protein